MTSLRRAAAGMLTLLAAYALPHPAHATADPLVDGARQCTQYLAREEQRQGIPTHLLTAVASTESGRWHNGLGLALPWPWTINAEGKGYYFASKQEAMNKTYALLRSGVRSIDIGCMQVNLKHHPDAFRTLNEAFDPASNVAYGAKFLRHNYEDLGDWVKATAAYHSRTPVFGKRYLGTIEKNWSRIVAKVDQARTRAGMPVENKGISAHALRQGAAQLAQGTTGATVRRGAPSPRSTPRSTPRDITTDATAHTTTQPAKRFRVIQVSGAGQSTIPSAQVSVTRPANDNGMLVQGRSDTIRKVNLASAKTTRPSPSRFVFAN